MVLLKLTNWFHLAIMSELAMTYNFRSAYWTIALSTKWLTFDITYIDYNAQCNPGRTYASTDGRCRDCGIQLRRFGITVWHPLFVQKYPVLRRFHRAHQVNEEWLQLLDSSSLIKWANIKLTHWSSLHNLKIVKSIKFGFNDIGILTFVCHNIWEILQFRVNLIAGGCLCDLKWHEP